MHIKNIKYLYITCFAIVMFKYIILVRGGVGCVWGVCVCVRVHAI